MEVAGSATSSQCGVPRSTCTRALVLKCPTIRNAFPGPLYSVVTGTAIVAYFCVAMGAAGAALCTACAARVVYGRATHPVVSPGSTIAAQWGVSRITGMVVLRNTV